MRAPRLLMMHVTTNSGHHRASRAIERAIHRKDPAASVVSVDAFDYTSRFVRWAIYRIYYSLIQHQPDVWEYLYDNPGVGRQIQFLRALLHRYHTGKFEKLLDHVRPDAIVCTQAFPCGMAADFKQRSGIQVPIVGVLTDYAPHLYWFHDKVDRYVVPSNQVRRRFIARGVDPKKIDVRGIPIDDRFVQPVDKAAVCLELSLDPQEPILLIMGGGSGLGQLREVVMHLDMLPSKCQLLVLAGTNDSLVQWIQTQSFRHRVIGLPYVEDVHRYMALATILISKPGGLTTAESLAAQLPMVIVNPIPGQEAYNARFLLSEGAAVQAASPLLVRQTVRDLLENPERLKRLRARTAELAYPRAAQQISELIYQLIAQPMPLSHALVQDAA